MADPVAKIYAQRQKNIMKSLRHYTAPKRKHFRASGLSTCKTALYFQQAGYIPAAEDVSMSGYGPDGDMHHDQVRRDLVEAGVKVSGVRFDANGRVTETESHVIDVTYRDQKFTISMRLDGFIHISQRKHVLEIKSLGFWKYKPIAEVWEKSKSEAAVLGWIIANRKDFLYQTHACMLGAKTYRAYLLFKDRDSCKMGLHAGDTTNHIIGGPIVMFDPGVWDSVCARLATVCQALDTGTPPPPEFIPSSRECGYCKYKHLCHGAANRERQGLTPAQFHPQLGTTLKVRGR